MRILREDEIHTYLLNILKAFKAFTAENNIDFMLCGGTTLGAVRHKGFIPWDDDIDIYISRKERDRIIEIAKTNPYIDKEKRYRILVPGELPNVYPFIKIIDEHTIIYEKNISKKYATGIYIDVFCLSYWPNSKDETIKALNKIRFYKKMNQIAIDGNHKQLKKKLIWLVFLPLRFVLLATDKGSSYWCKKILEMDSFPESDYVGDVAWPDGFHDRYEAIWFKERIEVPFEDDFFFIPKEYDKVLTTFYGDYMQIPPEEKRVRHGFEAFEK